MTQGTLEQGTNVAASQSDELVARQALLSLHDELDTHRRADRDRSYLNKAFDFVWRSDEKSFDKLTELEKQLSERVRQGDYDAAAKMRDEVNAAVKKDRDALGLQNNISFYGSTGVKVGALFFGGPVGWGATAALYALDQANPNDTLGKQFVDGGMGAVKGVAFKGLLGGVLASSAAIPLKGAAMSFGGRALDTLLTSDNYYDRKAGGFNLMTGLKATGKELLNVEHLAVDAAVMGLSFGVGYGVSRALGASIGTSPFYTRVATSGVAGMSRGAIAEMHAMRVAGQEIQWGQVGTKALLMGGVYALAAVPGALQAEYAAREQTSQNDMQQQGDKPQFHEYRKVGTVRAEQLKEATTWTTSKGEVMQAAAGDWKITGGDGSTWSVKPDIFQQTYSPVAGSSGEFAKTAITRATKLTAPITIQTLEGQGSGVAGDYLVVGPKGEQYIVGGQKFESMYQPIPPKN